MANSSYLFALGLVVIALVTPQVLGVTIPIPWDQSTNYGDFVKQLSFAVGDVLEFKYGLSHSVSEVSEADYDSCTGSSPINHYSSGDDKVTLSTAKDYYFICPTSGHCPPMKIKVTAVDTSTTPPATPTPTPPTAPTTGSSPPPPPPSSTKTPGTTNSPPPPPPPPNGASGVKTTGFVLGASFVVAAAMGLFF